MDTKTLEYMGARVDKARKLQEKITEINKSLKMMANNDAHEMRLTLKNGGAVYFGKNYAGTDVVLPEVKDAVVEILTAYRDQLQKELDEL